jgi:hypothetical protein
MSSALGKFQRGFWKRGMTVNGAFLAWYIMIDDELRISVDFDTTLFEDFVLSRDK